MPLPEMVSPVPQPAIRSTLEPARKPNPNKNYLRIVIPIAVLGIVVCICGVAGFYLFSDQIMALIRPGRGGNLTLDPRAEDGTVSGQYRNPNGLEDNIVNFTVTADGFATYRIEGAPESETLTVALSDDQTTNLTWAGYTLDGMGALTGEEQAALGSLMNNDLAYALALVPLDIGCQGDENIDALQVAALLVPLQMRFKYWIADRVTETNNLIAASNCDYGSEEEKKTEQASYVQFSASMPVPVVMGYFPFDEEGAVEPTASLVPGAEIACLPASSMMADGGLVTFNPLAVSPETISGKQVNIKGPCNALCRGACGVDCTLNNCTLSTRLDCEKNEQGNNTGMQIRFLVYDCGIHQGCIDHDACYDNCHLIYPCGSWRAAYCRHGQTSEYLLGSKTEGYCDQKAIQEYGYINAIQWARGYGPQPAREIFEYTDEAYGRILAVEKCPSEELVFTITPEELKGDRHTIYQFSMQVTGLTTATRTIRFDWDFGDSGSLSYPATGSQTQEITQPSADLTIAHKYEEPGEYTLEVSLYDDTYARNVLLGMVFVDVEILPDEFRVDIEPADPSGIAGQPISFNAVVNNPGDYRYDWTFDNTKQEDKGTDVSHTFDTPSVGYPVKVEVYDRQGNFLGSDQVNVVIFPAVTPTTEEGEGEEAGPPVTLTDLAIVPDSPVINTDVQFWVSGENWPANPAFDWDFGEPFFTNSNGSRSYQLWTTTPEAVWNYSEAGTFQVTVIIRDNENYPVILAKQSWWITVQGEEED
jgi:hypothetical protein